MKEEQDDESSDRDTMGGPLTARESAPPAQCAHDARWSVAAIAIAALERLASQHIESAHRLHAQEWKACDAGEHMREARRITDQIAAFVAQPNDKAQPRPDGRTQNL